MDSTLLHTRLGPVAIRSSGDGPALVLLAGALANGDLWRDVVAALDDRHRCITIDLPLGAHTQPLAPGADRSAASLARLQLDCLELLDLHDATVVANDTAGGLLLLALASGHPALGRIGRIVLTNCETYERFPPEALRRASAMARALPRLTRALLRLQLRLPAARAKVAASVAARPLDEERMRSFFTPARRDPRVAGDLVAAMAGFRPELLAAAAQVLPAWDRPVLLVWGDRCEFFPPGDAERLAADLPDATIVPVPGAKTWVPVDAPDVLAEAIAAFVAPRAAAR